MRSIGCFVVLWILLSVLISRLTGLQGYVAAGVAIIVLMALGLFPKD